MSTFRRRIFVAAALSVSALASLAQSLPTELPSAKTIAALNQIADRLGKAIAGGDRAELDRLYAPDAIVWVSTGSVTQTRAQALEIGSQLSKLLPGFHYENIRRNFFKDGYVQQHDGVGTGPKGPFRIPLLLLVHVRNHQITRVEEYYDSKLDPL